MTIVELIQDASAAWDREIPAPEEAVARLVTESGLELPEDYLSFLRKSNGGEGELGVQPCWFQIWRAEDVIEFGAGYEVPKYASGFFAFGSNGGGEILAFDTRIGTPWTIVAIPCIGLKPDEAMLVTSSFKEFVAQMGRVYQE